MADKNGVVITISGDSKDLEKALQSAAKSVLDVGKKLEEQGSSFDKLTGKASEFDKLAGTSFSSIGGKIGSVIESMGALGVVIGGAAVAAGGIYAAFKFAQIGEENEKISRSFSVFAQQAGLDAEVLKQKLGGIAEGFVDLDDVLPKASVAINDLGSNASKLPEIFQLAKNIGVATGRDINETFQELSKGIANQNEKMLKNNLIRVDAKKAIDDYAASLNVDASKLTESAKQHAVLNAVLEQGRTKFKDNAQQVAPLAGGLKKLELALDDLKDAFGAIANSKLGETFARIAEGSAIGIKAVADFFTQAKPTNDISREMGEIEAKMKEIKQSKLDNPAFAEGYNRQLNELNNKLRDLQTVQKAINEAKNNAPVKEDAQIQTGQTEEERKALEESLLKQQELKAQDRQTTLDAEAQHNLNLLALEEEYGVQSQAYKEAALQAELEKNQRALNSQIAKNASIKNNDEFAAANSLALSKKKAADQAAIDKKELDDKQKVSEAKGKIEENLFATASILARDNAELTKAINIAQAIRNTYQGASLALATYPPPFGGIAAATTIALGLAQVSKITAAADGGLVTAGAGSRVDDQSFLLARGEIVAPAKSFDEVVEGTARERGFVKGDENGGSSSQSINISIQGDFIGDDNYINNLTKKIQEAVQFRDAQLT